LIQVCADVSAPGTLARELRALCAAMSELGVSDATIVTLYDDRVIATDAGPVRLVPAWRWATE
jgi:hypothetical protein